MTHQPGVCVPLRALFLVQNHFIHHDHLGLDMTNRASVLTAQNLHRLIILIAVLMREQ